MVSPPGTASIFQSTLSLRRATAAPLAAFDCLNGFQSTLSLRRATLTADVAHRERKISIHALLAESDLIFCHRCVMLAHNFNPRSPCGERRTVFAACVVCGDFNPRSPCGERLLRHGHTQVPRDFNPRSPCGERPAAIVTLSQSEGISIHALLAESDAKPVTNPQHGPNFNPRSPCGERRAAHPLGQLVHIISIHALLAESDRSNRDHPEAGTNISIHALLAESDCWRREGARSAPSFQSTLSLRRATRGRR